MLTSVGVSDPSGAWETLRPGAGNMDPESPAIPERGLLTLSDAVWVDAVARSQVIAPSAALPMVGRAQSNEAARAQETGESCFRSHGRSMAPGTFELSRPILPEARSSTSGASAPRFPGQGHPVPSAPTRSLRRSHDRPPGY